MKYYIININGEDVAHLPGDWTEKEIREYINEFYEDQIDDIEIEVSWY